MDNGCISIGSFFIHSQHTAHEPIVHLVLGQIYGTNLLFLKIFIVLSTGIKLLNNNNKYLISNIY